MRYAVVYQPAAHLVEWASSRIENNQFRDDAKAIGVTRDGELAGVVVFDNFTVGSCCISVASDGTGRWLNREFLVKVFAYPFIQVGCWRLTALISETNIASIRFCTSCGFQREGVLRRGAPDGSDLLVYGLLRDECRFLPERMAGKIRPARL